MGWNLKHRPDTVKLLEENIEQKLLNIGLHNEFLIWHKAQTTKDKNEQMGVNQT